MVGNIVQKAGIGPESSDGYLIGIKTVKNKADKALKEKGNHPLKFSKV